MVLESLDPKLVWEIFEHVFTATPRESKKEEKIRTKLKTWLTERASSLGIDLTIIEDSAGNLLIKKQASKGMESVPPILLQGHMDMVCETDREGGFDFANESIPVRIQDNKKWVDADGTTLGADNGIGLSLALALLLDSSVKHGPLEVLITVDEETGLVGAFSIDPHKMNIKSKLLINIDSETLGTITIGSAGGGDSTLKQALNLKEPDGALKFYELTISGLFGGHSGVDIDKHRANANKLAARILTTLAQQIDVYLSSWNGGSKHNAIPREVTVRFAVSNSEGKLADDLLRKATNEILAYYKSQSKGAKQLEPDISIEWKAVNRFPVCPSDDSARIIFSINMIRHGPITFSPNVEGLVETSNNLAVVNTEGSVISVLLSTRSSVDSELEAFRSEVSTFAQLTGWDVEKKPAYPGWNPEPSSPFLKFIEEQYQDIANTDIRIEAIHAGLECGIIGAKIPGLQMVSIGPTLENAHTPDERVNIEDISILYKTLRAVLSRLTTAVL